MASFYVDGLEDFTKSLDGLAELPDEVVDKMLDAQGDIVVAAQKRTASTMLRGPYYQGGVAEAVSKGRFHKTRDGKWLEVVFKGTQHGEPLARIAYINEYGKVNQPARPFITTAIEQCAGDAAKKAETVYNDYLKSKNL